VTRHSANAKQAMASASSSALFLVKDMIHAHCCRHALGVTTL
jgi:hypothetical protein